MCGLVAVFSKQKTIGFTFRDKTIFLQMLISDMFRGLDSTGVFGVNKYGNLDMMKDASPASLMINKKDSEKFFNKLVNDYHVVVGHNRKATMGATTSENAHPFIEGDICLVHNGTLTNHRKLADQTVDSHAICDHINTEGYKSALKNMEGAYALIWYNVEEKTVYFCRNAERPLYLVETQDRIYLASEGKMLDWLLDRNDISKYTVQNVPTDKVFKFSMETRKLECEHKPKKAHLPQHQQSKWGSQHQTGYGNLALAYSSQHSSQEQNKPCINDYESGEIVSWSITDFDIGEKSCKLVGETLDNFRTDVVMYLDLSVYTQKKLDEIISAETVTSKISSITSKKGKVMLYMNTITPKIHWTDSTGVVIDPAKLDSAGACCYQCSKPVNTEQLVRDADITTNARGEVLYILCEQCADTSQFTRGMYC